MDMTLDLVSLILTILSAPIQLMRAVIFGLGNFLVFDVFQLGQFLPIPSPFA